MVSVSQQLHGKTILLTGGLGFLGSVCVQQLLTNTQPKSVYLLVRGKRDQSAQQRVIKLLAGPLFHDLHQQATASCSDCGGGSGSIASGAAASSSNVFSKIRVVDSDLEAPGLGLSDADRQLLQSEVEVIIHSAAVLTLDAHIHNALKANFGGTQRLLELAATMPRLRSFTYLSTFYVNNYKPQNTPVPEEVHHPTLQLAGDAHELSYSELADLLLALPADTAAAEVACIMSRLNFTSTYAFSKLLTEQLVDDPSTLPGVGKVIVRPSLIASMAGAPYPGYISGFAGAPGYSLAYAMGFFSSIDCVAFASDAIIDVIPVDTTAALVIAAAAAAAAHGPYAGSTARVYHAASAESYPERAPAFFDKLHDFWTASPPPFRLPFTEYPTFSGRHQPTSNSMRPGLRATRAKVWVIAKLLQLSGRARQACSLMAGVKAFSVQNNPRYARSIVSCVAHARELQRSLVPEEQGVWRCVWEQQQGADWETYTMTGLVGLRSIALKLPASDVKGFTHNFTLRQGLADPSIMAEWMLAAQDEHTAAAAGDAAAGVAACQAGSICSSVEVEGEHDDDDSSSSATSSSSPVGWAPLLSVADGLGHHVKRTKSCHAVLITAA